MPSISSGFTGTSVMVQAHPATLRQICGAVDDGRAPHFFRAVRQKAEAKMKRVLAIATFVLIGLVTAPLAVAAEMHSFWDLKPQQLRVLVAAPQVMVSQDISVAW